MPTEASRRLLAGTNILLVDDDVDVSGLLAEFLGALGYRVRVAHDGQQGLDLLREDVPDIVLLDIEMPRLDGPRMAYQMFVHDAGLEAIPIVLLSGAVGLPSFAARVGTPYFLAKPFDLDTLLALLDRALTERKAAIPTLESSSGDM